MSEGKFIVIEGGDGAGKTTFVNFLKERHPEFVYTREPGGMTFSQYIRPVILREEAKDADPLTMFHLFWASRAENTAKVIRPNLSSGKIVISDRFDVSTFAYQVSERPDLEESFWFMRRTCLSGLVPIYINLDVDTTISKTRLGARGDTNHFDVRSEDYRLRVKSMYLRFFSNEAIKSFIIDANRPEEEVMASAYNILKRLLD